jgi:hypothetical protein
MKSAGIAQSDLMKRQASSLFEISQSLAEDGGVLDSDAHLAPRFVSFDKIRIDAPPQLQAMADLVDDDLFIIASSAGVTAEFRPNDLTFVVVAIAIVGSLGIGYATILYLGYRRWRYG